jgi:hypothetical protein
MAHRLLLLRKEGRFMAEVILVPLKKEDRIDEVIHYVEKLAQPGMKVVFLVHWIRSGFASIQAYGQIMETGTGISTALAGVKMAEALELHRQKGAIEEKVFPLCHNLQKNSVGIAVDVYTGSQKKAIASYAGKANVDVLMLRTGVRLGIMSLLNTAVPSWLLFKRPGFSPVFVLHPGT